MYTKATLERLRAMRARPQAQPILSPNGAIAQVVNSQVKAANEYAIAQHRSSLKAAHEQMRGDRAKAVSKGLVRVRFNQQTKEMKP